MRYRWIVVAAVACLGGGLAGAQTSDVKVTDVTPRLVDYPKGPNVKLRNPAKTAGMEAWVTRHLEGVVVKRYSIPPLDRWERQVEIALPFDLLPSRVKQGQPSVPYAIVVVTAAGEVKVNVPFEVRVAPSAGPKPWHAQGPFDMQWVASGEIMDIKATEVAVKTSTGSTKKAASEVTVKDIFGASKKYVFTDDTKTTAGSVKAPAAWGVGKDLMAATGTTTWGKATGTATATSKIAPPSPGDKIFFSYSEQDNVGMIKEVGYKVPGTFFNPWEPGPIEVGIVKSALAVPAAPDVLIVETTKDGVGVEGTWRIDAATDKVFAGAVASLKDVKAGHVVGVRKKAGAPAKGPVPVDRFIVLTAPSGP